MVMLMRDLLLLLVHPKVIKWLFIYCILDLNQRRTDWACARLNFFFSETISNKANDLSLFHLFFKHEITTFIFSLITPPCIDTFKYTWNSKCSCLSYRQTNDLIKCNLNKMATVGHGPSQSTCKDCYGVAITTNSSSLVQIQLTGRFPYEGIMLLVKDKYTNKTLGEFQNFDENLFAPVACDDDEDEQDHIEPDSIAVLGHIDSKLKHWPVHVGWNMVVDKPLTDLKLVGMIVVRENRSSFLFFFFLIKSYLVDRL